MLLFIFIDFSALGSFDLNRLTAPSAEVVRAGFPKNPKRGGRLSRDAIFPKVRVEMDSIETGNLLLDGRFPRLFACERVGCSAARVAYAPRAGVPKSL